MQFCLIFSSLLIADLELLDLNNVDFHSYTTTIGMLCLKFNCKLTTGTI